jgi:hypothetical protein
MGYEESTRQVERGIERAGNVAVILGLLVIVAVIIHWA